MLGKPSQGFLGTSSLISLVPRQVMLEGCSVVAAAGGAQLAEKKTKKRRKGEQEEKKGVPLARAALLRAIAAFLEGGGFSRTLAALRSEAQLEIDDGSEYPVLDLEEIICSYLESSKDPVVGNITGPEEQVPFSDLQYIKTITDAQKKAPRKEEEGTHDHSEEPICKKKKKKAKGSDDNLRTESDKAACDNGDALPNKLEDKLLDHETAENQLTESHMESKEQKRKKSKKVPKEIVESGNEKLLTLVKEKLEEVVPSLENASSVLDETNVKFKDKKKKKNKLTSDSPCGEVNQVEGEKGKSKESERKTDSELPTFATENAASENPMEKDNSKSKDKKKRKHNPMVENSCRDNVEVQNGSMSNGGKKGKSVSHDLEEDANGSDKKTGNISSPPNTGNIDKKAKKRKRSASEETELHVDDDASVQEPKQKKPENLKEQTNKGKTENLDDSLLNNDLHTSGKKKKSEKSEYNSEMTASTPVKQSELPKNAKETPAAGISQSETKGQQEVNGNLAKNECEGNGSLKSKKADFRHSAEPKTVNAFQRVKADEVEFADERLQDNSYWAKDGAETGYGAKAQEVLGQVRGRDFRHEKTKKKRGSYRGGQIDFQSHSVKFQYSDDEE